MKKLFLCVLINLPLLSSADYWTQKASYPVSPSGSFATSVHIGNAGYAGLGSFNNNVYYNNWWKYDKPSNTWIQMADLPGAARMDAFGFAVGNMAYVVGGINNSGLLKDVWQYDAVNNTWTQKNDFPGNFRAGAKGFVINGRVFMGSGQVDMVPNYTNDFWEYDPSADTWQQKNNLPGSARTDALGMAIDGTGYYGLGLASGGNFQNDFWQYDTLSDSWTGKPGYAGPPSYGIARFSILNLGYVGTGFISISPTFTSEWWQYNPVSQQWIQKTSFAGPNPGGGSISFSINNKGYVGVYFYGGGYTNQFWEYSPDSTTDIAELQEPELTVRLYPDPVADVSFFELGKMPAPSYNLTIYDASGNRSREIKISNRITKLERGNLKPGIYFYRLSTSSGICKEGKFMVI